MSETRSPQQEHQHLYRITIGKLGIVRWCEHCGETHVMQAVVDILDMERAPKKYVWIKVEEQEQ
jgi:hypothetical protein